MNELYLEELLELIENALEPNYKDLASPSNVPHSKYNIEEHQPRHSTWIHFFWSYGGIAHEYPDVLTYADAEEFQNELINKIRAVFTPQTLEYIRQAKITEFGMQLGPYQPSGGNLNNELGIEVIPEMQDRKSN